MFNVIRGETIRLEDDDTKSTVTLAPARGAIVTELRVRDRDLLYLDEATLRDPAKNVRGGVPILFPSPGKLERDSFTRAGKSGTMKQHGFGRELPWTVGETGTHGAASATVSLTSSEQTRAQYPWDFAIGIKFSLAGTRLRLDVHVENTGSDAMPFGFGIHPYFAVSRKQDFKIATRATRAFDNVTKRVGPFNGFDLTAAEVDLHLLDHGSTSSHIDWGDGSSLAIRASAEFGRWVVWTVADKPFVCVEPWTAPGNALNTGESLLVLPPRAAKDLWIELAYAPRTSTP